MQWELFTDGFYKWWSKTFYHEKYFNLLQINVCCNKYYMANILYFKDVATIPGPWITMYTAKRQGSDFDIDK